MTRTERTGGMQVRFVQTGGIAGIDLVANVNTAQLPASERATIEQLVESALAERRPAQGKLLSRDDLEYEIHVRRGDTTYSLRSTETQLTPSVAALVRDLARRAGPVR